MRKADSSRLEALEALLAEKRKHENFLAKLEERRAGTPEHVFARLRDEYLHKFTDAQVKASVEAEALSSGLEDDEAAVIEAQSKLEALEEERVETQLRAEVEEWDAKETQKKMTAMNAAVSMAEKERDARKAVAERTRALLNEARGGTPAGGQPAVSGAPAPRGTTTGMAGGPNFDELAFLNSVVGRTSTPAAPLPRESKPVAMPAEIKESASAPAPAPVRSSTPVPAAAPVSVAAPSVPPSPAPAPPPVVQVAPQAAQSSLELVQGMPDAKAEAKPEPKAEPKPELKLEPKSESAPASSAEPKAADEPAEDAEEEPQSALGRPTPRTSQAVKTLKCSECGSFNYPTEWYCERCGGELAAL